MNITHLRRAVSASAAAIGLGLVLISASADAAIVGTDDPELYGDAVQFGAMWDPIEMIQGLRQPGGPGVLEWDVTSGNVTPRLRGTLHTEGIGGRCAKMRLYYYAAGTGGGYELLDARSSPAHCALDDRWEVTGVNIAPFSDPDIVRVVVATTLQNSSGRFDDVLAQEFFLG